MAGRGVVSLLGLVGVLGLSSLVMAQDGKQNSKWKILADIPVPQYACAAVVLDGKIHVLGGATAPDSMIDAHQVYDPAKNSWSSKARLPEKRGWPMTVLYKNKFYTFGGTRGSLKKTTMSDQGHYYVGVNTAWRYDPATDSWSDLAKMPQPRTMGAAVTVGDHIYIFGGNATRENPTLSTYRYDPAKNSYTRLSDMPERTRYIVRAYYKGHIHALSGDNNDGVLRYDVSNDRWTKLDIPRIQRRSAVLAQLSTHAVMGTKLLILGGALPGWKKRSDLATYFDMETKTFGKLEPMPARRCCGACGVVDGKLYVFGGHAQMPKNIEEVRAVWGYPF